tara:strand:- start:1008 stop:3197 length:2190 start_codon:yes stop_codon:yes gene_type:complete
MNNHSPLIRITLACLVMAVTWQPVDAQQSGLTVEYELGIDGEFKRGVWIPVRAEVMNNRNQEFTGSFVVEADDIDGVQVSYTNEQQQFTLAPGASLSRTQYIKVGRLPWRVVAGIKQQGQQEYVDQRLFDRGSGGNRKATSYFVMQLGKSLPISRSRLQSSLAADAELVEVSILQEDDFESLPDNWIGYEAIDLMILPTGTSGILERLSSAQARAIRDWVYQGGRLILFAGKNAQRITEAEHAFSDLIPGQPQAIVADWNTSGLENFGTAQQRLFLDSGQDVLSDLRVSDGRVLLRDQENAQAQYSLIVRSVRGFGMVVFVTFDIDTPAFENWNSTATVLEKLIAVGRNAGEDDDSLTGQSLNHAGYQDLSGQLRAAMEKFDSVTPVRFIWIAALLAFFVLLIGPLDYYVLERFNRYQLTWVTFPVAVILIGVIVTVMSNTLPGDSPLINQLHVVDIDAESGEVRGTDYLAIYSPEVSAFDVQLQMKSGAGIPEIHREFVRASWHGLPGTGLGALGRNSFQTYINHDYHAGGPDGHLTSVPVQHGGTKSLRSRWSGSIALGARPELYADPISGGLRGTVTNPLDVELFDVEILFDGRVYPVGRSFKPGATVDLFDLSGDSQGIDNYYARYQDGSSKGERRSWSVMNEPIHRIVKQMMFNQGIGGAKYTGLINRYEEFLDLSHALAYNRAVLVARTSQSNSQFSVTGEQAAAVGQQSHFYRVVYKVANAK